MRAICFGDVGCLSWMIREMRNKFFFFMSGVERLLNWGKANDKRNEIFINRMERLFIVLGSRVSSILLLFISWSIKHISSRLLYLSFFLFSCC